MDCFMCQYLIAVATVVTVSPVVVATAYYSVRAAAFAWFRTKREHLHIVLNELKNGEQQYGA